MSHFPTEPGAVTDADGAIRLELKEGAAVTPGGFWIRFVAVLIDGMIVSILVWSPTLLITFLMGLAVAASPESQDLVLATYYISYYLIYFLIAFFYFGWFYKNKGATPGKMLFRLRVNHIRSGRYIGYWHAFGREVLGKMVSTLTIFLGFIIAAFHPEKRALHDLLFSTRVVRVER